MPCHEMLGKNIKKSGVFLKIAWCMSASDLSPFSDWLHYSLSIKQLDYQLEI